MNVSKNQTKLNFNLDKKQFTFQNLIILKNHWELSKDQVELHMSDFRGLNNHPYSDDYSNPTTHDCGTSCCLLGLAPEVLPVNSRHFVHKGYNYLINPHGRRMVFDYLEFSATYFPYLHKKGNGKDINVLWSYLFDSRWPNDLDHALGRIQDVVEGKITKKLKYNRLNQLISDAVFEYDFGF